MRVQDHIGVISWSLADKGLFILYGFVLIIIMNYTEPAEFGLFSLLIALHTWIFTISDSFSLQSLIQFGMNENNRKKVNLLALISHIVLTFGASLIVFIFRHPLAELFSEPRIVEIASFLPVLSIAFIPRTYSQKIIYRIQNMFYLFLTNFAFFGTISAFIFLNITSTKLLTFTDLAYYYLFGSLASSTIALVLINKHLRFSHKGEISWRSIYRFSWKMTTVSILFTLPRLMDVFIIKMFFQLETVGLYAAAKNIFRVFDEALSAINSLLYPAAVRHIEHKNFGELYSLLTKSFSFGFVIFTVSFLLLYSGLSSIIFNFILPSSYSQSLDYFNILIIALPFLPFTFIYSVMVAMNKMNHIIIIVSIALIVFITISISIGENNLTSLIPLGLISYYILIGIIGFFYSKTTLNIPVKSIFRFFNDSKSYLSKH